MNVEGAAALVTGANRGLGAAIAQAFLDAGATVYGAARDNTSITNRDVIPVLLDVTSDDDIADAARTCGDVSIVVNNEGILRSSTSLAAGAVDAARAEIVALGERVGEVLGGPGAARGHHRHRDGAGDRAQQLEVVALAGAVAVHRREQDLARARAGRWPRRPTRPRRGPRRAPGVDEDLPALVAPLRVDRDDHALRPKRSAHRDRSAGRAPPRCSRSPCRPPLAGARARRRRSGRRRRP